MLLSRDGLLLFATCGVRSFAYGLLSVVLGLYLAALGLEAIAVGTLITVALAGAAAMTRVLTAVADQVGRRRVLILGALLMAAASAVFAVSENPLLLGLAAIVGTINPSTRETGPFPSVEQAILPQVSSPSRRTSMFAAYNMVRSLGNAVGALAVGLPALAGLEGLTGYRLLIWSYGALALVLLALFWRLSPAVEAARNDAARNVAVPGGSAPHAPASLARRWRLGIHRSRGIVLRLSALSAVDAFGGGFLVDSLIAYWFHERYGVDLAALAALFFGTNLLAALSFFAAEPLARRFGLLNTMVFTHLPSNVFAMLVPLMPNAGLAATMLLIRNSLSQLDVPARQSYTMAIVAPDERSAAAGLQSVARNGAAAISPALAGALMTPTLLPLGLPFFACGALKSAYDLALWSIFRYVRPPDEALA
jgi:MFS family permease